MTTTKPHKPETNNTKRLMKEVNKNKGKLESAYILFNTNDIGILSSVLEGTWITNELEIRESGT